VDVDARRPHHPLARRRRVLHEEDAAGEIPAVVQLAPDAERAAQVPRAARRVQARLQRLRRPDEDGRRLPLDAGHDVHAV
jgi:hypothetical protein